MGWMEFCLAASALSNFFVLIAWRHRFRSDAGKFRVRSVDLTARPIPSVVVTPAEMRRPDESKMAFLRLRSPKEKVNDYDRLKSPVGAYTGEPIPLPTPPRYPWKTVGFVILSICVAGLFISGFFGQLAPSVFLSVPQWPTDLFLKSGERGVVPQYPRIKTMFAHDQTFQDTGVQGDTAWRDMLPKGHGIVELRWPDHLKLPKKSTYIDGQKSDTAGVELGEVSVVKELDCLIKVRSALIGYEYNMQLSDPMKKEVHACLDYGKS